MFGIMPCHKEVGEEEGFGVLLFYKQFYFCRSILLHTWGLWLAEGVLCGLGNRIKSTPFSHVKLSNTSFSFPAVGEIKLFLKIDVQYTVATFATTKKGLPP